MEVLIIDDDLMTCRMLSKALMKMGHEAAYENTIDHALKEVKTNPYDIVFLDVKLPDGNGLDILPKIRATSSAPDVVIMTGFGNADGAEMALKNGAWDYIQKTASLEELKVLLKRIVQYREGLQKTQQVSAALNLEGIVGNSSSMKSCYDLLAKAAGSTTSVLITGETGTGKELFARAIHENSSRSGNRFVVVDCAALPGTLVESALFGYQKGAFTGADQTREGLVKQADGGTLFLDEVGELPHSVQKAFLRVLQERRFRPVGAKSETDSDFRLIAATNRDLNGMLLKGQFRKDLLYRLEALTINLPPLRERPEDIMDIVLFYIKKMCERNQLDSKGFSPEFLEALTNYKWPGNVRELKNVLETAFVAAMNDPTLFAIHLPMHIRVHSARASIKNQVQNHTDSEISQCISATMPSFRETIELTEKKYFQDLISHTKGDIKASCEISGLSRSRVYGLMKKHGIARPS